MSTNPSNSTSVPVEYGKKICVTVITEKVFDTAEGAVLKVLKWTKCLDSSCISSVENVVNQLNGEIVENAALIFDTATNSSYHVAHRPDDVLAIIEKHNVRHPSDIGFNGSKGKQSNVFNNIQTSSTPVSLFRRAD